LIFASKKKLLSLGPRASFQFMLSTARDRSSTAPL